MSKKSKQQIEHNEQIYQITAMVAGELSLQDTLDKLARAAVKTTKTKACSIRLLDAEAGDLKMRSTYGLSQEYRNKGVVSKEDPVIKAAFGGGAVVLDDMRLDSRVKYKEATIAEGLVSQLTVAMIFRNKPIGVLRLYSPRPKRFDDDDIVLARLVASQCAVAITNARLYSKAIEGAHMAEQLRLGGIIQRRMIPEYPPCVPGLDIGAIYRPCHQIGGDLYDFICVNDHSVIVAIADVIGKGVPAAMMMSMFRGTLRAYADGGYTRHGLDDIIKKLNGVACRECRNGEFITLFLASIDVQEKTINYCNCGHEPALLIRDGQVNELNEGGMVLGIMKENDYRVDTVSLKEKDTLLMYTDGLIDAVNFQGQMWGRENLLKVLQKYLDCCSERMIGNILGRRRRFVGLASQTDDTSIVAIKNDEMANRTF